MPPTQPNPMQEQPLCATNSTKRDADVSDADARSTSRSPTPERLCEETGGFNEAYSGIAKSAHGVSCIDCHRPDSEMPLDFVLTGEQWKKIHPEGAGVLCASCIVKRASRLPGVINLTARITFASDFDEDAPGGRYFQFLKNMESSPSPAITPDALAKMRRIRQLAETIHEGRKSPQMTPIILLLVDDLVKQVLALDASQVPVASEVRGEDAEVGEFEKWLQQGQIPLDRPDLIMAAKLAWEAGNIAGYKEGFEGGEEVLGLVARLRELAGEAARTQMHSAAWKVVNEVMKSPAPYGEAKGEAKPSTPDADRARELYKRIEDMPTVEWGEPNGTVSLIRWSDVLSEIEKAFSGAGRVEEGK